MKTNFIEGNAVKCLLKHLFENSVIIKAIKTTETI